MIVIPFLLLLYLDKLSNSYSYMLLPMPHNTLYKQWEV